MAPVMLPTLLFVKFDSAVDHTFSCYINLAMSLVNIAAMNCNGIF